MTKNVATLQRRIYRAEWTGERAYNALTYYAYT